MTELQETRVTERPALKNNRKVRKSDIVIFAIIGVVIVALSVFLYNHLVLKRDVSNAQTVSDKVIADLQKRDGGAARALGSPTFQKTYSAPQLTKQFKAIELATLKPPALNRTIVYTGYKGRMVFFIYKYTALKVPFYVRTGITHTGSHWYLTQISGSADESSLIL